LSLHNFRHGVQDEATNVVIALDFFPLALDQAGAYIEETGCGFRGYLKVYQDHRKELLAKRGEQATNYPDSVATTWSLSFQKVKQANPAAAELLRLCAFLAPNKIPDELIMDGAAHWNPPLQQVADLFIFDKIMRELLKYSLIKRLSDDKAFSIHSLVQAVQMDTMVLEVRRQWAERVVRAVNDVFPDNPYDIATWPQCLRYLDQVQACNTLIGQYVLPLIEAADLLNRTGFYLSEHALYAIAEPLLKRALLIREQQLGTEHPATALSLHNLAALYQGQGKYTEAEPLLKRALLIREQQLGTEHPATAQSLNILAMLYRNQGKYAEAELLLKRALAIYEQQSGAMHLDTATCLGSLAILYRNQGKYAEAETLLKRGLAIYEQQLGTAHPDTATWLRSLALLYQKQGKYAEAEPLYQRALRIYKQMLGPEHPDTQQARRNHAILLRTVGRDDEAKQLEEGS